jgi:hypothetical protein
VVRTVKEFLEGDFCLTEEDGIDRVDSQVVLRLLYMGAAGDNQQVRQQALQFARQRQELRGIPGVEAEPDDGLQASVPRRYRCREPVLPPGVQPRLDVGPALEVHQLDIRCSGRGAMASEVGC